MVTISNVSVIRVSVLAHRLYSDFQIFLWYEFEGSTNLCEMDFLRSFKEFPRNPPGILAAD